MTPKGKPAPKATKAPVPKPAPVGPKVPLAPKSKKPTGIPKQEKPEAGGYFSGGR
jgi:hypothetical protein